jgi:hypothetical protein
VKWSSGDQLAGKLGKLATGASIDGGLKVAASGTAGTGSTDTVGQSGRHSVDTRHDTSSQAAKDFKEGLTTSPAIKPVHQVTRQIIMQAPAWTSSLRHFPVRKTATTNIQTAVLAAMNLAKWLLEQKV